MDVLFLYVTYINETNIFLLFSFCFQRRWKTHEQQQTIFAHVIASNILLTSSSPHSLSSLFPLCHLTLFIPVQSFPLLIFKCCWNPEERWASHFHPLYCQCTLINTIHFNIQVIFLSPYFPFLFNLLSLTQNRRQRCSFQIIVTYVFISFVIWKCNQVFRFLSSCWNSSREVVQCTVKLPCLSWSTLQHVACDVLQLNPATTSTLLWLEQPSGGCFSQPSSRCCCSSSLYATATTILVSLNKHPVASSMILH